jgi:geranylgeranyl transferase type-1 subunit beta
MVACRITLAYFCLSALALLPSAAVSTAGAPGVPALDVMLKPAQIEGYRGWIYTLQAPSGGFRGSDSLAGAVDEGGAPLASSSHGARAQSGSGAAPLAPANVIQTYTAILALAILGDGFERLDRAGLVRFVGACQNQDGS